MLEVAAGCAGQGGRQGELRGGMAVQARRLMKASRIDVTSAEQDLQDDEDGSMADPDGVLRTVELYRQQQRQQQQQQASGAAPSTGWWQNIPLG